jgi:hypothetical protein
VALDHATQVAGEHATAAGLIEEQEPRAREIAELRQRIELLELAVKSPPEGLHNGDIYNGQATLFDQVERGDSYRDRSVVMVFPSYKPIASAVWSSWLSLLTPANHRVYRLLMQNYEVGEAYDRAIELILNNSALNTFGAVLTLEADNIVPPMAVMQLFSDMDKADVDVIGAMYWGKLPGGIPMAFGKFGDLPRNFRPFIPPARAVTRVNACAMGCTLFKMDIFRKVSQPWFKTHQAWTPNVAMEGLLTQDIFFADKAAKEAGVRFAVSTNVLVGHLDEVTGIVW